MLYVAITLVAALALFVAWQSRQTKRLVERMRRSLEEELARKPTDELLRMLREHEYFAFRMEGALRDTPTVKAFFERIEAEDYEALASELDSIMGLVGYFGQAERAVGNRGRPLVVDYLDISSIVRELARRQKPAGPR
jgi:hypothetical protein